MTSRTVITVTAASILFLQASAQLLSCSDVKCPTEGIFANCHIEDRILTTIGISQFTSTLSSSPLTWTVGYNPGAYGNITAEKSYYLSTPQGLDLNNNNDILGCAFFFTGIGSGLRFAKTNSTTPLGSASGTCADALGGSCEFDLIKQARILVGNSRTDLRCSDIASVLQSSPPVSCNTTDARGNITAKGPDSPPILKLGDCSPTINKTYDVRNFANFSNPGSKSFVVDVTPVMTIFRAVGNKTSALTSPEVHLNCLKPMSDDQHSPMPATGSGVELAVRKSVPSVLAAALGFLAMAVFSA